MQELYKKALEARKHAYTPYSKFNVGCAVKTESGRIFTGANVENASYGLTVCAERNAIFAAVNAGELKITHLCVVADVPEPVSPCGACRQVIREFGGKECTVIMGTCSGLTKTATLDELLPYSFGPEHLGI